MMTGVARRLLFGLATNPWFESLVRSNRATEGLAYRAARRYVAGVTLGEALETVRALLATGFGVTLDLFGEGAEDEASLEAVVDGYRTAAAAVDAIDDDVYLEIVPSHLGLDLGLDVCRRHVERLVELLPSGARLEISAEEARRTPHIMDLTVALARAGAPVQATVQANLRRSPDDVERLIAAQVPIRLVKGAYLESADDAHPWGEPTDIAYVRLAHQVRTGGVKLALATHDAVIREALLEAIPDATVEMLLGVRGDDARALLERGCPVRVYACYGQSWFRYWMRRVAEARGA